MANFQGPLYEDLKHFELIPAESFTLFDHVINVHCNSTSNLPSLVISMDFLTKCLWLQSS